jgi:hypothetical protein
MVELPDVSLFGLEPEMPDSHSWAFAHRAPQPRIQVPAMKLEQCQDSTQAKLLHWNVLNNIPYMEPYPYMQWWIEYVKKFRDHYTDLESVLSVEVYRKLCLKLIDEFTPQSGHVGFRVRKLLSQDVLDALKVLGQVLLCFLDKDFSEMLASLQLAPQDSKRLRNVWVTLLVASEHDELRLLVSVIDEQLNHSQRWTELPSKTMFFDCSDSGIEQRKQLVESVKRSLGAQADAPSHSSLRQVDSVVHAAGFEGSEWEKPVREGEMECLLHVCYLLALFVDRLAGKSPRQLPSGLAVPHTDWPRLFANWKFLCLGACFLLAYPWYLAGIDSR